MASFFYRERGMAPMERKPGFTTTKSDKTEGESHSPLLVRGNGDIYNYSERWEMYDR
jgi:hypothetical protein